jgi:uncharacterized DUF497 family protein
MFSWDAAKALKNYEKHGVSFEEASTTSNDPHALDVEDLEHVDTLSGDGNGWPIRSEDDSC